MTEESMLAPEECAGQRLDKAISEMLPSVSRSMAQKLIGEGSVIGLISPIWDAACQMTMSSTSSPAYSIPFRNFSLFFFIFFLSC